MLNTGFMISKIVISGQRNTGKTTLFWHLQKELGWPTFSVSQFLRDYIRANGLQGASSEAIAPHEGKMLEEINSRVYELLQVPDRVIVEVRAFYHVKQSFENTLKVLLTAGEETRIRRNAGRENIDVAKSRKRLVKREGKWQEKLAGQFGFEDFYAPEHYDLVVDTTGLSQEEVVKKILDIL